jgi:hypothetical protein
MQNESQRADDLRKAHLREAGLPIPQWRRVPGDEQKMWRAKARALTINGTDAATTTRRSGFTPASVSQREAIHIRGSVVSGKGPCDPAHLCPRALGGCGDPLCVVALTREEHRAFDDGELDIQPYLIANGHWEEIAHMTSAHHMSPLAVLQRLTGVRWVPAADAREQKSTPEEER